MKNSVIFIFVSFVILFASFEVKGQFPDVQCQNWVGEPEFCNSLFSPEHNPDLNGQEYQVWTSEMANFTQDAILEQVNQVFDTFLAPSPKFCGDLMIKFVCQFFRKCVPSVNNPQVSLMVRPCYKLCGAFLDVCYPVFDNTGSPEVMSLLRDQLANCVEKDDFGFDLYPFQGTTYPVPTENGVVMEFVPCEAYTGTPIDYEPPCPEPFVFVSDVFETGSQLGCLPPCPTFIYTEEEWDDAIIMITVVSWVGFVSTLLAGITQVLLPKHRKYPGVAALYVTLCVNQISFAFMVVATHGSRDVWCKNDYTNAGPDESFCVWQAFWLLYWALAGVFWWSTVAWNMFYIIYMKGTLSPMHHYVANICNWILPLIITVVGVSNDVLTYADTAHWCFINRNDDNWWQYGLFYIPVGVLILWSLFMTSFVLWEMRDIDGKKFYKYFRVLFFIFVWLYIYVFAFAYLGYNVQREDEFIEAAEEYVGCLFYGGSEDSCDLAKRTPYGFWMVFAFNVCGEGMFIALLWGTTKDTLTFWYIRFQNIKEGRSFFDGITSGNTSTSRGASNVQHADYDSDSFEG